MILIVFWINTLLVFFTLRSMSPIYDDTQELSLNWRGLNSLASAHPDPRIAKVQRDGHCHEAVMW